MSKDKSFLLLQGVASPFFNGLENALLDANQHCIKVNFCGGDLFSGSYFSKARNHINFDGDLSDLSKFYTVLFKQHSISDIVLFGDTRLIHVDAITLAKEQNINIHVFEEGYFRPNWVTLDSGGVNVNSAIHHQSLQHPQQAADWFLENSSDENWQEKSDDTGGNLLTRGWYDIRFHLTSWLFKRKFPHYKTHRPDSPLAEYWGFLRRIPLVTLFYQGRSNQKIQTLIDEQTPYFLLPLQLNADSQIRLHSDFNDLSDFIKTTMASFAKHANRDHKLVIKLHPLDPWFVDYNKLIIQLADQLNINRDRLLYLEAGDLNQLLKHCRGTVLVNSTAGITALAYDCPVIALGKAIYDIQGLTYQSKLNDFWADAAKENIKPDKALFQAFRECYIKATQINGSFYNRKGIEMAVNNSLPRLLKEP